jgi:hypothetical protein
MRLDEFEQERVGDFVRYSASLSDDVGERGYQLLLVGSEGRVKEAFGESDIDATISPRVDQEEWAADVERRLGLAERVVAPDAFDDLPSLFKPPAEDPSADNSIVCALRRERPGGTGFALLVPLFVPATANVFFAFPPAFVCAGAVLPVSGDPDLFLNVNSFVGPPVARSTFSGLFPDSIRFGTSPFAQFFPVFRVNGFLSSVTTFVGTSFGLP